MMHKNIYQDYFLKSNTSFDAFIHQCTFFFFVELMMQI